MTVIGKILTFLVFFMSVVFLGFAITINMMNKDTKTGQNWKSVAENLRQKIVPDLQNDLAQKDLDITKLRAEINKLTTDLRVTTDNAKKTVDQERDLRGAAETAATNARTAFENSQLAVKAAQDELEKRRLEAQNLHATIKQKDIAIANMQGEKTVLTNEKIQHQVASDTFQKRAASLERQVTDLTKALETERMEKADKIAATPGRLLAPRPPPEDVKGIVKSVTADGFVSISIGSDAGLLRGHTLEVFRLDPKPQYFGPLQIVEVGPHEAVGKLQVAKFAKQVQPNDQVATKILPSIPSR
jgi:hypothetical protein